MNAKRLEILVGAGFLVAGGIILAVKYQALGTQREQNEALRQQAGRLAREPEARPRASNDLAQAGPPAEAAPRELSRLRGELDAGRPTAELAQARAQNRQLRAATDEPGDPVEAEFKKQTLERVANLKVGGLDFHIYASRNNGQFPESWEQGVSASQTRGRAKDPAAFESYMNNLTNNFEIVYHGNTSGISKPGETIVFQEKQARLSPKGEWVKVYGFADGSVQVRTQPEESFDAWEQQHTFGPR